MIGSQESPHQGVPTLVHSSHQRTPSDYLPLHHSLHKIKNELTQSNVEPISLEGNKLSTPDRSSVDEDKVRRRLAATNIDITFDDLMRIKVVAGDDHKFALGLNKRLFSSDERARDAGLKGDDQDELDRMVFINHVSVDMYPDDSKCPTKRFAIIRKCLQDSNRHERNRLSKKKQQERALARPVLGLLDQ